MTRASAVHRSVPSVGLSSYSSRSCYVSLPSLLRWSPFLAAQFYVLSYRDAFTWEFCQPALPESIAGVIAATNKSPQLKKRRENSKLPQFSLLLFTLPSTNFFILGKWSSRICLGLSWRMMQMWTHTVCLCCAEFILRAKRLGGGQTEAFLPKHVHPVRQKNTHYHSTMGPTLGDNN